MARKPNLLAVEIDLDVWIDKPVADVFAFVTEVGNLPKWQESAVSAEWIERGARFRERRNFLGRTAQSEMEVTALEPDRRFDVRAVSGPVRFEIQHSFAERDGGTLLRIEARARVGGVLRFAASAARGQAQRQLRGDLDRLKQVLEERRDEESPSDRPPRLAED
jgi:uncharacterized membrane protein